MLGGFLCSLSNNLRFKGIKEKILTMEQQIKPREFKRSTLFVKELVVGALLFGFAGFWYLIMGKSTTAVIWFIGSVMLLLNYFWSKRTPYIQITEEEIMLSPYLARRPKIVKWDTIQRVNHISKKKAELILADDKKVKIYLSYIDKKDRENVMQILKSGIEEKNN